LRLLLQAELQKASVPVVLIIGQFAVRAPLGENSADHSETPGARFLKAMTVQYIAAPQQVPKTVPPSSSNEEGIVLAA